MVEEEELRQWETENKDRMKRDLKVSNRKQQCKEE